jgi:hypothetical protein
MVKSVSARMNDSVASPEGGAGSNITIATTESAAQLIVLWGLLYLDSNFRHYPYLVSRDSFLGYKYNVVVRPSVGWKASAELRQPVRVGTAWLSRAETKTVKDKLDAAQKAMQIQYEPPAPSLALLALRSHQSFSDLFDATRDARGAACHNHVTVGVEDLKGNCFSERVPVGTDLDGAGESVCLYPDPGRAKDEGVGDRAVVVAMDVPPST